MHTSRSSKCSYIWKGLKALCFLGDDFPVLSPSAPGHSGGLRASSQGPAQGLVHPWEVLQASVPSLPSHRGPLPSHRKWREVERGGGSPARFGFLQHTPNSQTLGHQKVCQIPSKISGMESCFVLFFSTLLDIVLTELVIADMLMFVRHQLNISLCFGFCQNNQLSVLVCQQCIACPKAWLSHGRRTLAQEECWSWFHTCTWLTAHSHATVNTAHQHSLCHD